MTKYFVLAVVLQAVIVLGVPAKRYYIESTGREVMLKIVPNDPYDPFGGYYEQIRYDISSPTNFSGNIEFKTDEKVFAVIEKQGDGLWKPVRLERSLPKGLPENQAVIKGQYRSWGITYPIDKFFIPENKRFEIDEYLKKHLDTARMIVKVNRNGEAVIIRLQVGDRVYE